MRKLVITQNMTIDGVIDMSADWFDPMGAAENADDIVAVNQEHDSTADALLVGRQTFEDFRSFWPKQTDDRTGITDYLNSVHKYVYSSTLQDPEWQNSTVLRGPLLDEVRALKAAPGKDIVATGSIRLMRALVPTDLVDEYRLFVYPVVVGDGARLFESTMDLELLEARSFTSGIVLLRYASRR